jgi:hypothetical protein
MGKIKNEAHCSNLAHPWHGQFNSAFNHSRPFCSSGFFKATSRQVAVSFNLREMQAQLDSFPERIVPRASSMQCKCSFFLAKADYKAG